MRIKFQDPAVAERFSFNIGQFGMFFAFGSGESTFNICSSSNWKDYIEFCFRKTGKVTEVLWQLDEGDTVGFRGPYGNAYPTKEWEGKNLVFIAGGIAMPPIRGGSDRSGRSTGASGLEADGVGEPAGADGADGFPPYARVAYCSELACSFVLCQSGDWRSRERQSPDWHSQRGKAKGHPGLQGLQGRCLR